MEMRHTYRTIRRKCLQAEILCMIFYKLDPTDGRYLNKSYLQTQRHLIILLNRYQEGDIMQQLFI